MRRFRFRLRRLERLREVRRQQARARLAEALARVATLKLERESRERALDASLAEGWPVEGELDVSRIRQRATWQEQMRTAVDRAAEGEQRARSGARTEAARYTEAAREHRVLERLRERRYERWQQDAEMEERKFLDEIRGDATRRPGGTTAGGGTDG